MTLLALRTAPWVSLLTITLVAAACFSSWAEELPVAGPAQPLAISQQSGLLTPDSPSLETPLQEDDWRERRISPHDREHWAFQRLSPKSIPQGNGMPHPIDAFLEQARREQGISAQEFADPRTQLRRLSYTLRGLSPSLSDIQEFAADTHPAAYEQWVDRFLADPRFGERWGRHWLDLVRFAESHGFEHDYDRPTAYHYRDFVVHAFNHDFPYHEFVRWQLAGDEISPDSRLAMTATGFLAAGVHSTQITRNEVERHRYDEMDDMLSTTGSVFLGLSLGCARCHDHKTDPIPQADYYRLLAAFTTTIRSEVLLLVDPVQDEQERSRFDQAHAPFEQAVRDYETQTLPEHWRNWTRSPEAHALKPVWLAPLSISVVPQEGHHAALQSDGSWLITGSSEEIDSCTITVTSQLPRIASLRIEALTDLHWTNGGPGRGTNGNFELSDLRVFAHHESVPEIERASPSQRLSLTNGRATFEQREHPATAATDNQPATFWAVDPQFGRSHAAAFDLSTLWLTPAGQRSVLVIQLTFGSRPRQGIGRLRISLSESPLHPPEPGTPVPEEVWQALQDNAVNASPASGQLPAAIAGWFCQRDAGWLVLDRQRSAHAATRPQPRRENVLVATENRPPIILHTQADREYLDETHFLERGEPHRKAGIAELGMLQVLSHPSAPDRWVPVANLSSGTSGRRTVLAHWITSTEEGAGALLARVIVNRLWQHHFGRGLVASASDFGLGGTPPTHPELLEWLAGELVQNGWQLKPIHRLIVTSAAFRQRAAMQNDLIESDPENLWLGRWSPRPLEAEALRDTFLLLANSLDDRMYGPGSLVAHQRRSLYYTVKRSQTIPMLTLFDAPDGTTSIPVRSRSIIAPQALWLLNDEQMRQLATQLAQRAGQFSTAPDQQVVWLYGQVLQREPTVNERQLASHFLSDQEPEALVGLCQTLLLLHEVSLIE